PMDRATLSSAIIAEMQTVLGEALERVVPELWTADLATLAQRAQAVGRVILGGLIERVAAGPTHLRPRPVGCGGRRGVWGQAEAAGAHTPARRLGRRLR